MQALHCKSNKRSNSVVSSIFEKNNQKTHEVTSIFKLSTGIFLGHEQ